MLFIAHKNKVHNKQNTNVPILADQVYTRVQQAGEPLNSSFKLLKIGIHLFITQIRVRSIVIIIAARYHSVLGIQLKQ